MLKILEAIVDGAVSRLLPQFGGDTSPRLPGEPLVRDSNTAYMSQFADQEQQLLNARTQSLYPNLNRNEMMQLMDDMDATDVATAVLDLVSEDATAHESDGIDGGNAIRVEGLKAVAGPVREMLRSIKAEETLYADVREMCKRGSHFKRLVYNPTDGITHAIDTNTFDMEIETHPLTREVAGFRQRGHTFRGKDHRTSWPWDFAHFKLKGQKTYEPYGTPLLAPGIRAWTMLTLAEDKALMYRIQRQPDRLLFKIDVGAASDAEAWRTIQAYKRQVLSKVVLDPVSQKLRKEWNPMGALENIYMGVRPNSGTDVVPLAGATNTQDVTDLLYLLKKFLSTVRVPPQMFGIPIDTGDQYVRNKRLANQDVRYARHIKRVQRSMCDALAVMARCHLRLTACNVEDPRLCYDPDENGKGGLRISLKAPSFLEELETLELLQLRMQIAQELLGLTGTLSTVEVFEWTLYVFREVLRLPEHVICKVVQRPPPEPDPEDASGAQPSAPRPAPRPAVAAGRPAPLALPRPATTPATPLNGLSPLGSSRMDVRGPDLTDNAGFQYTKGGELNESQIARLSAMVQNSPSLRHSLRRAHILFSEDSDAPASHA